MYLIKPLIGWVIRVKNPGRCKKFSLFRNVQTGCVSHSTS